MHAIGRVGAVLLTATLLLTLPGCPAEAEKKAPASGDQAGTVGAWFDAAGHRGYASAQPKVEQAADQAAKAGVPEGLLVERLDEGAAKDVGAPVLERALEDDAARLAAMAGILDRVAPRLGLVPRTDALREGALALRAGIDPATIERTLTASAAAGQDVRRTMAALAAVGSLRRILGTAADGASDLALALARSREPPARYGSLVSLLSSACSRGLDSRSALIGALVALSRSGTLAAVRQELDARLRP